MSPSAPSTSSSVVWGKRPREGEESLFVRFSELSPAEKLERRRQERQEKKEKQRTIAYFESMQRALAECQQNLSEVDVNNSVAGLSESNNPGNSSLALASLIDGFFSELFKLLRTDPSFNLLRNNVVCKTIDAALANATLLHVKSLLHFFLGHAFDLIISPVASYTVEMLLMSLTQSLDKLKCNGLDDDYSHEMTLGSSGIHVGSGVGSTISLLSAFVEEVGESMKDIVCHEIGARALRSILLILAGHSLHNAPQLQHRIRFDAALDELTEAIVSAFYEVTTPAHSHLNDINSSTPSNSENKLEVGKANKQAPEQYNSVIYTISNDSAYHMWMSVAHASTTLSLIAQSLLKVCVKGSKACVLVQSSMEHAVDKFNNKHLLVSLLHDDKGVFLFQAYITTPTAVEIISMCNELDFNTAIAMYAKNISNECSREDDRQLLSNEDDGVSGANETSPHAKDKTKGEKREKKKKKSNKTLSCIRDNKNEEQDRKETVKETLEDAKIIFECAWAKALSITVAELPQMLNSESNEVQSLSYVLQDLALYAPTSIHLGFLWRQVIQPNLVAMFEIPLLAPVLTSLVKKCAFNSNSTLEQINNTTNNNNTILSEGHVPVDISEMLLHDRAKGINFFDVPRIFQVEVASALSTFMLSRATKGAIHFLLVENKLGNKGSELARYLLHLHFTASAAVQNSVDKLRIDDLLALLRTHKGSVVMQQFVRSAAQRAMNARASLSKRANYHNKEQESKSEEESEALRALPRFVRRLLPHLGELASDTFAAFVIEVLYDVGDVELKEQLLHGLVPLYEQMKKENYAPLMKSASHNSTNVNRQGNSNLNSHSENAEDEKEIDENVSDNPLLMRQRQFILRKVLRKCCVEQFVHRNADWRKAAERQAQVQRLMYRILLQPTNDTS